LPERSFAPQWSAERVQQLIELICHISGVDDEERRRLLGAVAAVADQLVRNENVTGLPKLTDILGEPIVTKTSTPK
jgi:hypothetical protein